jgi:hypothetical protein
LIGLWLAGCTSPPLDLPPVEVQVVASDLTGSGGTLTVTSAYPSASEEPADLPDVPEVEGLTFEATEAARVERLGDRTVVTQTYRFSGKKGSYEVRPLELTVGSLAAESAPVWVDLGVEAPNLAQLADIAEPSPVWTVPYGPILCGLSGMVGLAGMVVLAFVRVARPRERVEVVDPPDVRCLRAWELCREDPTLTDEDRATELSRLFRVYTEEVLGFPAVSWTTSEILAHLEGLPHLPKGNVPRAKKLLRATDLVKYAEVSPGEDFFEPMDADLRAFVGSTRPPVWPPPPPPAEVPPPASPEATDG